MTDSRTPSAHPESDGAAGVEQTPLRLLVVDDHPMIVDGLKAMLAPHARRALIVGTCTDAGDVLPVLRAQTPDIVLLDMRVGRSSGLDICADILQEQPGCRVVFLTVYDDEQYLYEALRSGARGFLLKQVTGGQLVEHLERVRDGDIVVDPALAGRVALAAARRQGGEFWPGARLGLTQRESEVLRQAVSGLSNRAIAERLFLGEETVKSHLRAIYRKLDVSDRAQAVAVALRERIVQ